MKKFPIDYQDGKKDCGVSALLMILKWYGGDISKEYLRELTYTTREGTTAFHLIEAGKKLGLQGKGVKGSVEQLDFRLLPCIAHTVEEKSYQHFVVIYQLDLKHRRLIIGDPRKGIKRLSMEEFLKISTGQFLIFQAERKLLPWKEDAILKKSILCLILDEKKAFFLLFLLIFWIVLLEFLCSYEWKILFEWVIENETRKNFMTVGFLFLFLPLCTNLFHLLQRKLINNWDYLFDTRLSEQIMKHLLSLSYHYYKNRTTGEILLRFQDLKAVRVLISEGLVTIFANGIMSIFFLSILFLISWQMTLCLLAMVLIMVFVITLFSNWLEKAIVAYKEEEGQVETFLIETIGGMESIKNLHVEENVLDHFTLLAKKKQERILHLQNLLVKESFLKKLTQDWGVNLILLFGSNLILGGKLSIGTLLFYQSLYSYFLYPIFELDTLLQRWKEAHISMRRMNELLNVPIEKQQTHYTEDKSLAGQIEVRDLVYSYDHKHPVLNHLDLIVERKEKILLYGKSGSGKSTLAKLLAFKLVPGRKRILLDGKDILDWNSDVLKMDICYLSQDEVLFTGSIYQNIICYREIDYDEFLKVCKICQVENFATKNILAYDMMLEEDGFNISGGERQRILLARSLLKKSKIYILDEVFSQMDTASERQILEQIFSYLEGATVIVISHRFYNLDLFDRSIQIDKGKIRETQPQFD